MFAAVRASPPEASTVSPRVSARRRIWARAGGRSRSVVAARAREVRLRAALRLALEREERSREIHERYRALLGAAEDGFCVVDVIADEAGTRALDYRFVELNATFARQTGLVDAIGRTARELVPGLDESWYETYGRVALTGEPALFEREAPAMSRWFEVEAVRVGAPERRRVAIRFRDITARRDAVLALHESERRAREAAAQAELERGILDAILEAAPAGIILADATGKLVRFNAANELLWGPAPLSRRVEEYWAWVGWWADGSERRGRRVAPEEWAMSRALRGEISRGDIVEIEPFGQPGVRRTTVNCGAPVRDAEGRITGAVVVQMDISALVEAESARRQSESREQQALLEADRRKDEFIAILAHELRNPLAPVRHAVEILYRVGSAEPPVQRARDVIGRQVAHMARLIDDLLDVSRIARGNLILQTETCDLAAIAVRTAEDYRASLEGAGLCLVVPEPSGPVWVEGDPVRLAQMIGNLLHNAGRFTDSGGFVEVRADHDDASRLALVTVTDSGVGMEPGLLSRLFDPFSQASQDLARSKGGLGLGLALTKGLAELHGGGVAAGSEGPGRGSTFTLRIPLSHARYEVAPAARPVARTGEGLRILVVEDNEDAAETLGYLLELGGHQVKLAFDGASAVVAARETAPDVVISDLGLPGELDGYAVARTLRADRAHERVYLIALSGYANEDARRRSREAGFDLHLAKPPDLATLERTLADVHAGGAERPAGGGPPEADHRECRRAPEVG